MAKRKAQHKQQRNIVFLEMMATLGGKSVSHRSKKDYRRQPKHRHTQADANNAKGWDSQPFLLGTAYVKINYKIERLTCDDNN